MSAIVPDRDGAEIYNGTVVLLPPRQLGDSWRGQGDQKAVVLDIRSDGKLLIVEDLGRNLHKVDPSRVVVISTDWS